MDYTQLAILALLHTCAEEAKAVTAQLHEAHERQVRIMETLTTIFTYLDERSIGRHAKQLV